MPTNIQTVRKVALSLPGVEEGSCHGTPAFYVRRKLILRLKEDGRTLLIVYPMEGRTALISGAPDIFFVTDHYRNHPAVLMNLPASNRKLLATMIEGAWRMRASRRLVHKLEGAGARKTQSHASLKPANPRLRSKP